MVLLHPLVRVHTRRKTQSAHGVETMSYQSMQLQDVDTSLYKRHVAAGKNLPRKQVPFFYD